LLLRCLCTALHAPEDKKKARAKGLASYLLESILQLGPTFIKVGQLSSTRSDLFPAEFVEELSKLQVSG
jgi:predicted unusual protein kinase regulating ubiquinone biosynthesis (AarF/ABC1/UbiB family)